MGCINPEYITMNILIYTTEPFPSGAAATNRILSYCHGFIENKASVTVITNSSRKSKKSSNYGNWFKQVKVVSFAMPDCLQSKVSRLIHRQLTWLRTSLTVRYFLKNGDFDAVIFYGSGNIEVEKLVCNLSNTYSIPTFKEISEHPALKLDENRHNLSSESQERLIKNQYSMYHTILSMTTVIKKYLENVGLTSDKTIVVPQTVILNRFHNNTILPNLRFKEYIAYTGSFSDSKDGVLKLIDAFNFVKESYANLGLVIAGFGTKEQKAAIQKKINENKITLYVQVIENLDNEYVPSLISHAKLLVLCRPNSLQAQYGFPTKAVEYLATGNPVLTTAHGDMQSYFKHGQNSFVLESTEPSNVAKSIIEVLNNYDNAMLVGQNGKRLAESCFDSIRNSRIILDIIEKGRL